MTEIKMQHHRRFRPARVPDRSTTQLGVYTIHTAQTDSGTHFTDLIGDGWRPEDIKRMLADGKWFRCHSFKRARLMAEGSAGLGDRPSRPHKLYRPTRTR